MDYVLEMKHVSKSFNGVPALEKVSLKIRKGEVHALMGENGAGKSTLMKILTGLVRADLGEIRLHGEIVNISSPQAALLYGIAMIHQELSPIEEMSVAENIFLGREPTNYGSLFVDYRKMVDQTQILLDEFNLKINPNSKVSSLSIAQKQMLEIIKALSYNAKLVVMDEPTSALSDEEVNILFKAIKKIKKKDIPVIYISHRMDEIFKITDSITVLRDGCYIGTEMTEKIDENKLITMMVGRSLETIFTSKSMIRENIVLEVKNLTRKPYFYNINFKVREGEILGITGLMGAGRSEVMNGIFGIDSIDEGEIYLNGKRLQIKEPSDAINFGLAMVTEDRKDSGLVLCRSIKENMTLSSLRNVSKGFFISKKREVEVCEEMTSNTKLKFHSLDQAVESLSGGNQQKVVIAKCLMTRPKVLILDEPTRGIDIGAKFEIYKMMSELAKKGLAIILVSSELQEVIGLSDRILVMNEGKINGEFQSNQVTQEEILECAIGADK